MKKRENRRGAKQPPKPKKNGPLKSDMSFEAAVRKVLSAPQPDKPKSN